MTTGGDSDSDTEVTTLTGGAGTSRPLVNYGDRMPYRQGSESPAPFLSDSRQMEGERIRQMAKRLIGPDVAEKQLSNEISAPYEVPQYPIEQIETKLIRVKKEFEGVAAIPPNTNVVAASAASTASAAASEAATIPGSQFEPRLGTIQDAEGGGQLPQPQQQASDSEVTEKTDETTVSSPTPVAVAALAAAGVSSETDSVHIPESKLQDVLKMAGKMDRKYSTMSHASEAEANLDEMDEDYTPHFQRVYISGDDNTGVS